MSVSVGGTAVATATSGSISVAEDNVTQNQPDMYRADFFDLTEQAALSDLPLNEVFLQMTSFSDPTAITTLDLPLTPPNPAQFVYFASPYLALTYRGPDCDPLDLCPSGAVQASVQSISIVPSGPDGDGNGIDDILETGNDTFADDGTTSGSIVDRNGLTVAITDAAPEGVTVRVTGDGTAKATLIVCGITLQLGPEP